MSGPAGQLSGTGLLERRGRQLRRTAMRPQVLPRESRPPGVGPAVTRTYILSERADVPGALDDVLLTALATRKADRYETVVNLRNDLQAVVDQF